MNESAKILLACHNEHLYERLSRELQPLGLDVIRASSCAELQSRLRNGADFLAALVENVFAGRDLEERADERWPGRRPLTAHRGLAFRRPHRISRHRGERGRRLRGA